MFYTVVSVLYTGGIVTCCEGLLRGTARDDMRPGLGIMEKKIGTYVEMLKCRETIYQQAMK